MRSSDVAATFILVILAAVTMFLAISFERARAELWSGLRSAAELTGNYAQMNTFLIQMEVVFWVIFLLSLLGIIIIYFISSHKEEGETYAPPQEYIYP